MITRNKIELSARYYGRRAISATYQGARLIWEAVSNCLAGGWWQHGHGWDYGTGWGANRKK